MTNENNLIDKNQHVREYLDYYLETDIDLEYAVLLKGNWGSGKTYFIKDYIKDIKSRIENPQNKSEFRKYLDKEILYISLNGVNKLDDIYNLIFESKYVITARTKFLYNSLKFVSGFNKHSEKFMKQLDVYQFNKKKKKEDENKKTILVFDDIERVSKNILISDLLGFIFREFIEKSNAKIILLTDEEKISKKDEEENEYFKIKEKSIGKTLEVESDFNSAFNSFIENIDDNCKKLLENCKNSILEIHEISEHNNLRLLKQSIYDFDRLYLILDDEIKEDKDFMKEFLIQFLIYSIEYKKGERIQEFEDIFNFPYLSKDELMKKIIDNRKKNEENMELSEEIMSDKYKVLKTVSIQRNYNIKWREILDKGVFNKNLVSLRVKEKERLYSKLWNYHYSTDEEFEENIKFTINIIKEKKEIKKIKDFDELKHILGVLLEGFNREFTVIKDEFKSLDEIINFLKSYAIFMFKNGIKLKIGYSDSPYQFKEDKSDEFKNFSSFLIKESQKKDFLSAEDHIKKLFNNLNEENLEEFKKYLNIYYENKEIYSQTPIFKNIVSLEFFNKIIKLKDIGPILNVFHSRYGQKSIDLSEEMYFFEEFVELLRKEMKKQKGKLSAYKISIYIPEYEKFIKITKNKQL